MVLEVLAVVVLSLAGTYTWRVRRLLQSLTISERLQADSWLALQRLIKTYEALIDEVRERDS